MSFTTLYLRSTAANVGGGTLPSGLFETWGASGSAGARSGANARALDTANGASTTSYTQAVTAAQVTCAFAQFASPSLAAQTIAAGSWAIGDAVAATTSATNSHRGRAALHLIDGATGAIRSTIFAATLFGAAKAHAGASWWTNYATNIAGSSVVASDGDYLLLEIGESCSTSDTMSFRCNNATAISSDDANVTTPRSFLTSPTTIYVSGETPPGVLAPPIPPPPYALLAR